MLIQNSGKPQTYHLNKPQQNSIMDRIMLWRKITQAILVRGVSMLGFTEFIKVLGYFAPIV